MKVHIADNTVTISENGRVLGSFPDESRYWQRLFRLLDLDTSPAESGEPDGGTDA